MSAGSGDRLSHNRELWRLVNARHTDAVAGEDWRRPVIRWGLSERPESDLGALGHVAGLDVLDLAGGTGYVAAALVRQGASALTLDLSRAQLDTARSLQATVGPEFPLVEANAEVLPFRDRSFDLVVSEHGAGAWCDPTEWLPEAARVLRPGGRLVFLTNSVLAALCVPADGGVATEQLQRTLRDLSPVAWPGGGIEHHPSHGTWIRELRAAGFVIDALHELYPADGAGPHPFYEIVSPDWATAWPAEELWVASLP